VTQSHAEVNATMAILKALKIYGGGINKVFAIGATCNTFKGVLLTDGKPSINAEQFMSAILDIIHY